jgi:hypothetical protein
MDERRQFERSDSYKHGRIRFPGMSATFDCVVKDISAGGAMLLTSSALAIPSEFQLMLEGEQPRHCVVKWRESFRLGVEFQAAAQ